jgi:hypothetical protein
MPPPIKQRIDEYGRPVPILATSAAADVMSGLAVSSFGAGRKLVTTGPGAIGWE